VKVQFEKPFLSRNHNQRDEAGSWHERYQQPPDGQPRIDRKMLTAKAKELDRTIRKLTEMRDGLRHAAACRAPSHMECPTFRRILRAAASGAFRPQRKRV
jgi:hypothetical protein